MIEQKKEWFGEWFDSPFYHVLYKNRDYVEAQRFIDTLAVSLGLGSEDRVLDLACGKGRHSIYLNKKGVDVVGVDLSEQSITHAKQFENDKLHFQIRDMRQDFNVGSFDYVFNLFTSFGYFESKEENYLAIENVAKALKPEGVLVLDFLNPYVVINHLVAEEVKTIEGIEFHITKEYTEDAYIVKHIKFEVEGVAYAFHEKVKAIRRVEFLEYFERAGLSVVNIFGDYALNPYDCDASDRMIFIVKK